MTIQVVTCFIAAEVAFCTVMYCTWAITWWSLLHYRLLNSKKIEIWSTKQTRNQPAAGPFNCHFCFALLGSFSSWLVAYSRRGEGTERLHVLQWCKVRGSTSPVNCTSKKRGHLVQNGILLEELKWLPLANLQAPFHIFLSSLSIRLGQGCPHPERLARCGPRQASVLQDPSSGSQASLVTLQICL